MRFEKEFTSFRDGLKELMEVSYSAEQALTHWRDYGDLPLTEEEATMQLARNVILNRPTKNGYGWDTCAISITADGVEYKTSGGLVFGWKVGFEGGEMTDTYVFFLQHPKGEAPADSTLRKSATEKGWIEKR